MVEHVVSRKVSDRDNNGINYFSQCLNSTVWYIANYEEVFV